MKKTLLFARNDENIKISIEIYFNEKDQLYFYGYDIGKSVKEFQGDLDYEYTYTIEQDEVNKFYQLFELKEGDKNGLLLAIQKRFGVNEAYSLFGKFMNQHGIKYTNFSWT